MEDKQKGVFIFNFKITRKTLKYIYTHLGYVYIHDKHMYTHIHILNMYTKQTQFKREFYDKVI